MMKLHGHLSEEEINMRAPLHGAHKIGLYKTVEMEIRREWHLWTNTKL